MEDGQVIGQIACVVHLHVDAPADLYIDNLGVTPDRQRRGIARELIRLAREAGRDFGISTTWLAVDPDNDLAQEVYRRTGASGAPALMFSYEETTGPSDANGG
jgi:aminoglycoside 6'-N-acetyltransferase I